MIFSANLLNSEMSDLVEQGDFYEMHVRKSNNLFLYSMTEI